MARKIRLQAGTIRAIAELNETQTARAIWEALPFRAKGARWGDEIYFPIPVSLQLEKGQELVSVGDLGYWPEGKCFCIFFGPTPISQGEEIRPASPVNVFGRILGNARVFQAVASGTKVTVEKEGDE